MSDFLLSTDPTDAPRVEDLLARLTLGGQRPALLAQGSFGSLAVTGTPYHGLQPLEEGASLFWVLGDPLLAAVDDATPPATARSRALLRRWRESASALRPEHPATICHLDRDTGELRLLIDAGGGAPVFLGQHGTRLVLGSTPDLVAALLTSPVDTTAAADLVINRRICFPYTLYADVRQLRPGASHGFRLAGDARHAEEVLWWSPPAQEERPEADWIAAIRGALAETLQQLETQLGRQGTMTLSAGMDTRWLAILATDSRFALDAVCITDAENAERRIARQVAARLGMPFHGLDRPNDHYVRLLLGQPIWAGSQNLWHHAHFIGLDLEVVGSFVLGGYGADTALKCGETSLLARKLALVAGQLAAGAPFWQINPVAAGSPLAPFMAELDGRYTELARLLGRQGEPLAEAFGLWPFTQRATFGHYYANRRFLPIYEPFLSRAMTDLAFRLPTRFKLDGIFTRAAAAELGRHADITLNPNQRGLVGFARRTFGGQGRLDRLKRLLVRLRFLRSWYNAGSWTLGHTISEDPALRQATLTATEHLEAALGTRYAELDAVNVSTIAALLQIEAALTLGKG